jgi:ferredoxin-NADP reductase
MTSPPADTHVLWQSATIERIVPQTTRVKSIVLRPEQWRAFRAGQHLDVRLTAPDGYEAQRSYSVASSPGAEGFYELVIERLEYGEVSPYLLDVTQPGDTIKIRGPFGGHFVWGEEDGGPLLLIGGGSGVAPLMSMVRLRAAAGSDVPTCLVHAARSWDDVLFRDELITLDDADANFSLIVSLSRDSVRRSKDVNRRIDAEVIREALVGLGSEPRLTLVCGANRFVEAISTHLLDLGISRGSIRTERFGG